MPELEANIRDGIEWYEWEGVSDAQCARCGSSASSLRCWNCDHGTIEVNVGDDVVEEMQDGPCELCKGAGGSWHCLSSPEWCEAHPLAGRENVKSTALKGEAWLDND